MSTATPSRTRLPSIDIARFFAIVLVFYGHLVEQFMYLAAGGGSPLSTPGGDHYKWVYSFHMPAFFLLAGVVFNSRHLNERISAFLKRRWSGRLQPYFVFSAITALIALGVAGWFPTLQPQGLLTPSASDYFDGLLDTLGGFPAFSVPLWFLAALVSVEILHYIVGRWLQQTPAMIAAIIAAYLMGVLLNRAYDPFQSGWYVWLAFVAPLGYAFYLSGILLRRSGILERSYPRWQLAIAASVLILGVTLTYDLNNGPWELGLEAVVLLVGAVGHAGLFPVTAVMGIALILIVARLVPQWRWLQYLGEITITIYGLHGIFYHFVNPRVAQWADSALGPWLPQQLPLGPEIALLLVASVVTALSVAATVPAAWAIHRYLPQVIGRG